MVFFAQIVVVEESRAERSNSYEKLSANPFLSLIRFQCSIPSISFHDGSGPGIVSRNTSRPGDCLGGSNVSCSLMFHLFYFARLGLDQTRAGEII